MLVEEYTDELGEVHITSITVERKRDNEMWDEVETQIKDPITDKVHLSEIDKLKQLYEASPPIIKIKVKGKWHVMPFSNSKVCEEAFKRLRYQYHVFQENY